MMLAFTYGEKTQSYSSYKNDKFARHLDKLKNQVRQIKDCSLNLADKIKLLKRLSDEILSESDQMKS
jgi:hypothetical protein